MQCNDSSTADFVIVAENREIYVHRSVLLTQSPFLAKFLRSDPTCTRINANNARYAAMRGVLQCLYALPADYLTLTDDVCAALIKSSLRFTGSAKKGHAAAGESLEDLVGDFPTVISAWEIALHFQLVPIGHYIATNLLMPLIDTNNVTRTLRAALKHRHDVPDAASVVNWILENHLIPPALSTPQAIADWETLCDKYSWLRDVQKPAEPEVGSVVTAAQTAWGGDRLPEVSAFAPQRPAARAVSSSSTFPSHGSDDAATAEPRSLSTGSNDRRGRLAVEKARSGSVGPAVPEKATLPQHLGTVATNERAVARGEKPTVDPPDHRMAHDDTVSPQRDRIRRHHQASLQMLADRQQTEVDRDVADAVDVERRMLAEEERAYREQLAQWDRESEHLLALQRNLETEDLDVAECVRRARESERRLAEYDTQIAELAKAEAELKRALKENDEYLRSTRSYIPAASNAAAELEHKLDQWTDLVDAAKYTAAVMDGGSGSTAAATALRQACAQYAQQLRQEKDLTLRSCETEGRMADALQRHVDNERAICSRLQAAIDEHENILLQDAAA